MKFTEIEIPVYVLDKLAWKHHVNEQEVRQALRNRPKVRFWQRGRYERKDLYLANRRRALSERLFHSEGERESLYN